MAHTRSGMRVYDSFILISFTVVAQFGIFSVGTESVFGAEGALRPPSPLVCPPKHAPDSSPVLILASLDKSILQVRTLPSMHIHKTRSVCIAFRVHLVLQNWLYVTTMFEELRRLVFNDHLTQREVSRVCLLLIDSKKVDELYECQIYERKK